MNPTPKSELDRIDATDPLARALRIAFANALAAAPTRHSRQTPECVPMSRFVLITQHGSTLTDAERQHLAGCAFCDRNWKAFQAPEAEGPPSVPARDRDEFPEAPDEREAAATVTFDGDTGTVVNFGASDETTQIDPHPRKPPTPPHDPTAPDREDRWEPAPRDAEPSEDELLVEGLRCRVPEAIERFYAEYYQTFLRVMIRLTGDFTTAQDLAHDTVLKVINKAGTYRPGVGPGSWFMAVLRGTFLDWTRRRKVRRSDSLAVGPDGGDIELPAHEPTAEERAELGERAGAVQAALLMLDAEQRLLVTLRVHEEMSLPAICEVMSAETGGQVATYGQVSGRLHQAKLRLRALLEEHWPDLFP